MLIRKGIGYDIIAFIASAYAAAAIGMYGSIFHASVFLHPMRIQPQEISIDMGSIFSSLELMVRFIFAPILVMAITIPVAAIAWIICATTIRQTNKKSKFFVFMVGGVIGVILMYTIPLLLFIGVDWNKAGNIDIMSVFLYMFVFLNTIFPAYILFLAGGLAALVYRAIAYLETSSPIEVYAPNGDREATP